MGGPVTRAGFLLAVVFLAAASWAGEVKKDDKKAAAGPPIVNKDDGIMYSADSIEQFVPVVLTPVTLKDLRLDIRGLDDIKTWSRVRKETQPANPTTGTPEITHIALPLKYPIDDRVWASAPDAVKFLVTTNPQMYIEVDIDRDGKLRGSHESFNRNNNGTFGPITGITLRHDRVQAAPYSMMLALDPESPNQYYRFRTNLVWKGAIPSAKKKKDSEEVLLIDANNDALFDDYGVDQIKVGDKPPMPLPQLILIKGQMYHLRVHSSGSFVQTKPYEGATGQLDMFSKLDLPKGTKLTSLIIQNETGTFSIDISPSNKTGSWAGEAPVTLPVGKYSIVKGMIALKDEVAVIRQGEMPAMEVKTGAVTTVEWGMPFSMAAEITANVTGLNVDKIKVFGKAKEAYIAEGAQAPVVTVQFKGKTAKYPVTLDTQGMYAAWFSDPGLKGIYKVGLTLSHKLLGNLEVEPQELAYKPTFGE